MEQQQKYFKAKVYRPLIVLVSVVFLASLAMQFGARYWLFISWMHDYMGMFLVVFAMLKLFDVAGFAEGFSMYDLIASRFKIYGLAYPFIEFSLGLLFLSRLFLPAVYILTSIIMIIGSIGVIRSLAKGLDVNCACMGTVLKVPLSTVAIIEDLSMALMSLIMLITFR